MGEWNYLGSDNNEYTHCFHRYPATMIPKVARKIISNYGKPGMTLIDPYCGSGTSLVEAKLSGMKSYGFDLNNTARKISKAKTQIYNIGKLGRYIRKIKKNIYEIQTPKIRDFTVPQGFTLESVQSWFPDKTILEISSILNYLKKDYPNEKFYNFALIALSDCFRDVSFQRNHEFKLYRIPREERDNFYVEIKPLFINKLFRNYQGVVNLQKDLCAKGFLRSTSSKISKNNSVNEDLNFFPNFDIAVTSPPYGDSATTVAYAQFSWLTNVWLGLDPRSSSALDRDLMGGIVSDNIKSTGCEVIDKSISKIAKVDHKRARDVYSFYRDYKLSIENISKKINPLGYSCYVVGNRTVKGEFLRTDIFTKELFEENNFEHLVTETRDLYNTRMPGKISPSGKKGITASTMKNEYIVISRKLA